MSVVNASIHSVLGGFEIEVFVNLILYGIICVQAYIYALSSKRDPTLLRTVVAAIWSLETLHIGLLIHSLYQYAIIGFGRLAYANILIWDVGANADYLAGAVFLHQQDTYFGQAFSCVYSPHGHASRCTNIIRPRMQPLQLGHTNSRIGRDFGQTRVLWSP
ncbi:hypothetical protein K474DRAFT_179697 [Panus rudis PR-1116 ss-1]|nr:hypothetical protein K474DRAFT_179697 [Panus rudis PR-1116 ss-1]